MYTFIHIYIMNTFMYIYIYIDINTYVRISRRYYDMCSGKYTMHNHRILLLNDSTPHFAKRLVAPSRSAPAAKKWLWTQG